MKILFLVLSLLSPAAFAEGAMGGLQQSLSPFIPLILIFAIFYFMILRPQQKKLKQHQQFLVDLKKGDMVVTNSGIIGTIRNLSDKFVTLEIDDGVCVKIVRGQILESANTLKEDVKLKPA